MVILERQGVFVKFSGERAGIEAVKKSLNIFVPDAVHAASYINGHWDGYIQFYYIKPYKRFYFGLTEIVKRALDKQGIPYKLVGFETQSTSWIKFSEPFLSEERDYQRKSILAWFEQGFGKIKIPTRGGKTFVSAEIVRLLRILNPKVKVAFVTEATDVFTQNAKEMAKFLGEDVGLIRGEVFDPKGITMVMAQTAASAIKKPVKKVTKMVAKKPVPMSFQEQREYMAQKTARRNQMYEFLKSVDFLIVDEIQEFSGKARIHMLRSFSNITHILGLSATPYRREDDIGNMNLVSLFGEIAYEVEEKVLVEKGVLAESRVLLLLHQHPYYHKTAYQEVWDAAIKHNVKRNKALQSVIDVCLRNEIKLLVMFTSKEHGYAMEELTGMPFLCGDHTDEQREYAKEWFIEGKGKTMLVSNIWKKGVTVSEAQAFLNADGGKEETAVIQKRGRVLGTTEDKKRALVIDFADISQQYFGEHSLNRIRAYEEKIGEDKIDALDVGDTDFEEQLENYITGWFNEQE